jgi:hypothetical protein
MDRSTRKAALGVAAKVALTMSSVSALGCASSVAIEQSTATNGASSSASGGGHGGASVTGGGGVVSASASSSATGAGGAASSSGAGGGGNCGLIEGPDGGQIDPMMFGCCIPFLAQYAPDGGGPFSDSAASDPYVEACCAAIIDDVDHNTQDYVKVPFQEMNACCTLLHYPAGPACTPWGPPVPPAMPASWLEELA